MPLVMWPIGTFSSAVFGEQRLPHPPRDHPVQGADAVGVARQLERQHRHAERLVGIAGIHPPQPHEVVVRQVERLPDLAQVLLDQAGGKPIVAGGDRRVRREHRHRRPRRASPRQTAAPLDSIIDADHLERRKGTVPLVEMQHPGIECPAPAAHAPRRPPAAAPGGSGPGRRRHRAAPSASGPTRCSRARSSRASSSVVRPTSTRQTRHAARPVAVSIAISSGLPSGPLTLSIGSRSRSALR